MQSREAFRWRPLRLLREAEEAVRKNCLPGAMLSCGSMLWQGDAAEVCCHFELFERAGIKAPENAVLAQALSDALQASGEAGEGNAH